MSTFLQLVNDVGRESGTMGGQTLGSVTSAAGRWLKLVAWTRQAWELIQAERSDWTFRRADFSANLTATQARYTAADLGIFDFAGWEREADNFSPYSIYDPAIGKADERRLPVVNYRAWAIGYDIGSPDPNRPNTVTFDFQRRLCVGPTPDKAYTIRGAYRRNVQSLTVDGDEPYIDPDYHQAIVWRALMLLGDDDESPFETATSFAQYRIIRSAMMREYLEQVET